MKYTLNMERPAKHKGGDRYLIQETGKYIYVPQGLSRQGSTLYQKLGMSISKSSVPDAHEFTLRKQASAKGDDRYTPVPGNNIWEGDIYMPRTWLSEKLYIRLQPS